MIGRCDIEQNPRSVSDEERAYDRWSNTELPMSCDIFQADTKLV